MVIIVCCSGSDLRVVLMIFALGSDSNLRVILVLFYAWFWCVVLGVI